METAEQKKVYMYQADGKYIMEFNTLRESCLFLKDNNHVDSDKKITQMKPNISKSISNGWCAYGFKWSYTKLEKEWLKSENQEVLKFIHCDDPEVIYIIKTGFEDTYIVVHEDAFEITLGSTFVGSKEDIEKRYNIEI